MKNKVQSILWSVLIIGLVSCSSVPPKSSTPNASGVGITLSMFIHAGLVNYEVFKADYIMIIELKNNTSDFKRSETLKIRPYSCEGFNNWAKDSLDSFALDLPSGTYAAIGAVGHTKESNRKCVVMFPEKMIKETIVNLHPDSVVYMGKYDLSSGPILNKMEKADEIQMYYYDLTYQNTVKAKVAVSPDKMSALPYMYAPILEKFDKSEELKKSFVMKYKEKFANTEWAKKIGNNTFL